MNRVLKQGPIPHHVAFIMDGNRRFAREQNINRSHGHLKGFERLAKTLDWCLELGITEVTVYAFSIENFKRSQEEVDGIMDLAREKFIKLIAEKDKLMEHGVRVRVLGKLTMLPEDLQITIAYAEEMTKDNNKAQLNVCMAYTSREEMCHAMREAAEGVQRGILQEDDLSEDVLEQCLYTSQSPSPDLLLRTSGEVRLSDFLLWQSSYAVLSFMPVLWPDFSVWHLYVGVLHYQLNYYAVQEALALKISDAKCRQNMMDNIKIREELSKKGSSQPHIEIDLLIQKRVEDRRKRVENFVEYVHNKRRDHNESLAAKYSESASGICA